MKIKYMLLALISALVLLFSGCVGEKEDHEKCAICGKEATRTVSGNAKSMIDMGVDLDDCEKVNEYIYRVHVCNSCLNAPVVEGW